MNETTLAKRVGREDGQDWPMFAWPGGYVIGYVTDDGELLCGECMTTQAESVHFDGVADGWRIDAADILEEGGPIYCAHCYRTMLEGDETD